jgi:signal transduction histidine kinase
MRSSSMAVTRRLSLQTLSLHGRLLLVIAVALLPVVLLAVAGLVALGRQQNAQAQRALVERARAIGSAVDLELFNSIETLKVLALSERLDSGELARFHAQARSSAEGHAGWDGIILADAAGTRLLNTRVPYGAPFPGGAEVIEKDSFDAVIATRQPSIGNIALGPGGRPRFAVRVPVVRGGELRYVLTAFVKPDLMLEILARQKVPSESVSTVFDTNLTVVARSRNHEHWVTAPLSGTLVRMMSGADEGSGLTSTLEGQQVYSAFARSPRSSWGVALGVPKETIDAPIWRSYALSGAGLLLSLALGVMASAWLARRVARELQKASTELEASNKELEAFSYSVSHDLRGPVRAIDGFSSLLLQDHADSLSAEGRRYLETVRANAKQMGQLIDDLLAFARLARQEIARRRFDPRPLVDECVEKLRAQTGNPAAECVAGALPACDADPGLVRQVFMNLIGNAFKYSAKAARPRVEIGCERREGEDAYFVRDNGVGFDMKYAGKLFGVFQRLHSNEEFEGTGVGLAIVQRIVQRHGGRIWAQAAPGEGATFYFTLARPVKSGASQDG